MAKRKRLMVVQYHDDMDAERLKTNLKMCCAPFVAFREHEFVGGGALWKFYIDKGKWTWEQIKHTVNIVKPVRFKYESGIWIENGLLHQDCGTLY